MSKNTLMASLFTAPAVSLPEPMINLGKTTHALKAAFESATDEPLVTRGELEEHLEEDRREHDTLQAEINELQRTRGLIHDAGGILGMAVELNNPVDGDLAMSNIALESIARRLGDVPPVLDASVASMEAAGEWLAKLKTTAKETMQKVVQSYTLMGLRSEKSIALYRQRIAYLRKVKPSSGTDIKAEVKLQRKPLEALLLGDGFSTDLPGDLKRFFIFSDSVIRNTAKEYSRSLKAIGDNFPGIKAASDNTEFENMLKKCAAEAVEFDFFKKIEPGTQPYLGNLLYTQPLYHGNVKYPSWMLPVMKMHECAGYEVEHVKARSAVKAIPTLTTTQCEALLAEIEVGLTLMEEGNEIWNKLMYDCTDLWSDNIESLGGNSPSFYPWNCSLDEANEQHLYMVAHSGSYVVPLHTTAAMINVPLNDSVFAALLLVEHSLLGR